VPPVTRKFATEPCTGPHCGEDLRTSRVGPEDVGHAVRMAREIPEVVRAAAGLAATVLDEARKLPETLPGLPVRLIGLTMQQAMKVQQQYAGLVARGDELFTGLRGANEPGLATFDDEPDAAPSSGYRESAFDRAGDDFTASALDQTLSDSEVESLPGDPAADAVTSVVDELADGVETGRQSIEELVEEAPAIEEILDEIAIDELVDQAPTLEETAPGTPALSLVDDSSVTEDAAALESALLESDDSPAAADSPADDAPVDAEPTVDVLTPDGQIASVEAAVTDEGIAAPEAPETGAPDADDDTVATTDTAATHTNAGPATATDESGSDVAAATGVRTDVGTSDSAAEEDAIAEGAAVGAVGDASGAPTDEPQGAGELSGSQAAGTAPIDGYDGFSIAELRGRLRGYALKTVEELLGYEEATRAREPYLRLLRNRLENLEEQAVESSPLAPRGT
jgi:hypothetical protein